MMKLLIVSREHAGDRAFGLGKAIGTIAGGLRAQGHDVRYITVADWDHSTRQRYQRLIRFGNILARFFGYADYVIPAFAERFLQGMIGAETIHSDRYTHVWFQDPWIMAGYLFRRKTLRNFPAVIQGVSEHGLGSFTQAVILDGFALTDAWSRLLLKIERFVLKRCHFVWAPTAAALTLLARDLGYPTIPPSWKTMGYGKPILATVEKSVAREELGWDREALYVIAVGRIAPVKRYDLFIDACAYAQQSIPGLRPVIVGGELGDNLTRHAQEAKMDPMPIGVFTEKIELYLAAADIYVSACDAESFGLANMEAVCAELPCIIAAGGGAIEVIRNGGWLCHADSLSLGEALRHLAHNRSEREYWSDAARKRSNDYHSWERVIRDYETEFLSFDAS